MFGAMCPSCHLKPFSMFIHTVKGSDWSKRPVHRDAGSPPPSRLCSHCQPPLAPPTTATMKPLSLISTENFHAVVDLYYSRAHMSPVFGRSPVRGLLPTSPTYHT